MSLLLLLLSCAAEPAPAQVPVVQAAALEAAASELAPAPAAQAPAAPEAPPEVDMRRYLRPPPPGFVDLRDAVPGIRLEIRYHGSDNFTGAPVPGYGAPGAWLRQEVARALAQVQASLAPRGLGLHVYDAYRPYRATRAFVAWATRTHQVFLLDNGYIARRSGHNKGDTIDLTLVELETGALPDMGTLWDVLDERSHTMKASGQALTNRLILRDAMKAQGFAPYSKEWWHFQFNLEGATHRDVPYGCFEPDEGAWTPPEGWEQPGWTAPAAWDPRAGVPEGAAPQGC